MGGDRASQRHLGSPQGGSEGHWGSPGGPLGSPWGEKGGPLASLALTDPPGGPPGGGRGPSATQRVVLRGPGGPPGGGWGALEGLKRDPKAALEETVGRRGDIAKSLFLLHEMVHFGLWRGAWAGPMATKRGRGHHMEPDDRADEEKASQEGTGLKNGSEKEDGDNCTGPLWGCPLSKSALSPRRQCYL